MLFVFLILMAVGTLVGLAYAAALGALVLWITRWPGLRPWPFVAFVLCEIFASLTYARYAEAFRFRTAEMPPSQASGFIAFCWVVVIGAVAGWIGAALVALGLWRGRRG